VLVGALVLLASAIAALGLASPAAATPCGDMVVADWFDDGRIDRLYRLQCYEDALEAIPSEIRAYSSAGEVIRRALQDALRGKLPGSMPIDEQPPPGPGETEPPPVVAPDVTTSGSSAVPIPLLVLGGMSLALLAAGGFGYVSRRRRAAGSEGARDEDTLV
jgi:hypothetical protein